MNIVDYNWIMLFTCIAIYAIAQLASFVNNRIIHQRNYRGFTYQIDHLEKTNKELNKIIIEYKDQFKIKNDQYKNLEADHEQLYKAYSDLAMAKMPVYELTPKGFRIVSK